jgi:hypothetical protein
LDPLFQEIKHLPYTSWKAAFLNAGKFIISEKDIIQDI